MNEVYDVYKAWCLQAEIVIISFLEARLYILGPCWC